MKQLGGFVLAGVFGGLIVLGGLQFTGVAKTSGEDTAFDTKFVNNSRVNQGLSVPESFTTAAENAMESVVHIRAMQTEKATRSDRDERELDIFRDFFGDGSLGNGAPRGGTGSGVILQNNGYIVTNNHVVDGADELEVTLYDNRKFKAKLIGVDKSTDLAVIKIEDNDLPAINIGNSDKAKVGEWVLAVGNPFNLTSTVTAGIISAKGRNINIIEDAYKIESFIQTDAAVNPGNSGGALVDINGNLLGINTAIASQTGSFAGYSFAIPVNMMQKIVDDLIQHGEVQRGLIGVSIQDLDNEIADDLGLNITEGVHIIEVMEDGAAKEAGLLSDDIIIGVDNKDIKNTPQLQELVGRGRPGDKVKLNINRSGKQQDIVVTLKKSN
jgi:Do/DeqQ family serine protease